MAKFLCEILGLIMDKEFFEYLVLVFLGFFLLVPDLTPRACHLVPNFLFFNQKKQYPEFQVTTTILCNIKSVFFFSLMVVLFKWDKPEPS